MNEKNILDTILNSNESARIALAKAKNGPPEIIENILDQYLRTQRAAIQLELAMQRLIKKECIVQNNL
jgi:hypothetical protein